MMCKIMYTLCLEIMARLCSEFRLEPVDVWRMAG
jgi:hypothetical protein